MWDRNQVSAIWSLRLNAWTRALLFCMDRLKKSWLSSLVIAGLGAKIRTRYSPALTIGGAYIYVAFHFWLEADDTTLLSSLILLHTLQFWLMLIVARLLPSWVNGNQKTKVRREICTISEMFSPHSSNTSQTWGIEDDSRQPSWWCQPIRDFPLMFELSLRSPSFSLCDDLFQIYHLKCTYV
jgi:dolichyl-phosphate-mannose--protein O-mannosyl transferase